MMSGKLFSAGPWSVLEGLRRWTRAPQAALGRLLLQRTAPRLLSLSYADCTKEPSRKKLLSEKKLVRLLTGKELIQNLPLTGVAVNSCRVSICPDYLIEGTQVALENDERKLCKT